MLSGAHTHGVNIELTEERADGQKAPLQWYKIAYAMASKTSWLGGLPSSSCFWMILLSKGKSKILISSYRGIWGDDLVHEVANSLLECAVILHESANGVSRLTKVGLCEK